MRTRAGRTGPRSSSATPVLAAAGTAVAARAGRAVRAAACAETRGIGMVGTPARAARPRSDALVSERLPGAVVSSIVRMSALQRRDDGRRPHPPPGPIHVRPWTAGVGSPGLGDGLPSSERGERDLDPRGRAESPGRPNLAKNEPPVQVVLTAPRG